jgi:hypothetical protein
VFSGSPVAGGSGVGAGTARAAAEGSGVCRFDGGLGGSGSAIRGFDVAGTGGSGSGSRCGGAELGAGAANVDRGTLRGLAYPPGLASAAAGVMIGAGGRCTAWVGRTSCVVARAEPDPADGLTA